MKADNPDSSLTAEETKALRASSLLIVFYVLAVLVTDFCASSHCQIPFEWRIFSWSLADVLRPVSVGSNHPRLLLTAEYFDLFKFLFWLFIPLLFSLKSLDWKWLFPDSFERKDGYFLVLLIAISLVAFFALMTVPSLKEYYGHGGLAGKTTKTERAFCFVLWESSWLPGWEFLFRYVLLRALLQLNLRYLWLLLPILEGLYHLQKPWIEAAGMAVFSLLLTAWTVKRKNCFLPFCAHLLVEAFLLVILLQG
jgi:hypothetical protein